MPRVSCEVARLYANTELNGVSVLDISHTVIKFNTSAFLNKAHQYCHNCVTQKIAVFSADTLKYSSSATNYNTVHVEFCSLVKPTVATLRCSVGA